MYFKTHNSCKGKDTSKIKFDHCGNRATQFSRGGSGVECRTPDLGVVGSRPTGYHVVSLSEDIHTEKRYKLGTVLGYKIGIK